MALTRLALGLLSVFGLGALCALLFYLNRGAVGAVLLGAAVVIAGLLWRPMLGFYGVVFAALAIEVGDIGDLGLINTMVPLWTAFNTFSGIPLRFFPAELLMLVAFGLLLAKRAHDRQSPPRFGRLAVACLALLIALVAGLVRGLTFRDLQFGEPFFLDAAAQEIRGFAYIPLMYLFSHNVLDSPRRVRALLWVVIGALGFTAFLATWLTVQLGAEVFSLNEIAAHENSIYWCGLILLGIVLWLERGPARMRWACVALLPCVLVALAANQRRSAYIALGIALLITWALLLTNRPRRGSLLRLSVVASLLLLAYGVSFWHAKESPLSAPIYAFRSILEPDPSDFWSNKWREIENINIEHTIRRWPLLGVGFGQKFFLWVPLPSLEVYAAAFEYWNYMTHNAIYWVWLKLGAVGFVAFWYLIGSAIVLGCQVQRRLGDPVLRASAVLAIGLIVMLVVFSYADLGMASPKNMAILGALFGLLASLDRLAPALSPRRRFTARGMAAWR